MKLIQINNTQEFELLAQAAGIDRTMVDLKVKSKLISNG